MLPLIRMFHDGSQVDMGGDNSQYGDQYTGTTLIMFASQPTEFMEKWLPWLQHHPGVSKFLDPHYMFMQNVATLPDPGLAAVIAGFPGVVPAAHAQLVQFYTLNNPTNTCATATVLRTHYANPAGGGGPGAAQHIYI
jgi:hypothetical protein